MIWILDESVLDKLLLNMQTPLSKFAERIRDEKDEVEAKYSPQVRNHLKQLFDKAKVRDKKLEGIRAICGTVFLDGLYLTEYGTYEKVDCFDWKKHHSDGNPEYQETRDLFDALHEYQEGLCNGLPHIETI